MKIGEKAHFQYGRITEFNFKQMCEQYSNE